MRWLRLWWRQSDHYDWIMAYLTTRGLAGIVRTLIAGVTIVSGVAVIALAATPAMARGEALRIAAIAAGVGLMLLGLLWVLGVPTRRQSTLFSVATTTCIAISVLSCTDVGMALLLCATFAMPAGYIAFLHTATYAAYNFQTAMMLATFEAVRVALSGQLIEAMCALWLVFAVTLSVPASIQIIVHSLGVDLLEADSDPLTFLLNRRAFMVKAQELIRRGRGTDAYLMVMVVDLDAFKILNDTRGHPVGDRALVAVADILRAQTREAAVLGRSGGDEFLIADTTSRPNQTLAAERLRAAIADMPLPITASIGVAAHALIHIGDSDVEAVITDLVAAADHGMYRAKRAGGDRVQRVPAHGAADAQRAVHSGASGL